MTKNIDRKNIDVASHELVNAAATLAGVRALITNQFAGTPIDNNDFCALLLAATERCGTQLEDAAIQMGHGPIGYMPASQEMSNHGR